MVPGSLSVDTPTANHQWRIDNMYKKIFVCKKDPDLSINDGTWLGDLDQCDFCDSQEYCRRKYKEFTENED